MLYIKSTILTRDYFPSAAASSSFYLATFSLSLLLSLFRSDIYNVIKAIV